MNTPLDYYERLGVSTTATDDEIKRAYRKLSLKYHPDRSFQTGLSNEESTLMFRELNAAYSVLSDPNERAFYDNNKDSLLLGLDAGTSTNVPIFQYMSPSCFSGFGDDPGSFYSVYSKVFHELDREESFCPNYSPLPSFGNSRTSHDDVAKFYLHWESFVSKKSFSHEAEYNLHHAPNREIRRLMDKENKHTQSAARKAFNDKVRLLVVAVKRRDPRIMELNAIRLRKEEEMKRQQEEMIQAKKEARRRAREERQRRLEMEALEMEGEDEVEVEVDDNQVFVDEEFELLTVSENRSESDEDSFYCEFCKKKFGSVGQFKSHENSRKHKQNVAKHTPSESKPPKVKQRDSNVKNDGSDNSQTPAISHNKKKKKKKQGLVCGVCSVEFRSRNELFSHLEESGHALSPVELSSQSKKKRGKR
ncbi:hypothetical protein P9112_004486 [Eukaryota sp. TZLM1-RC]